MSGDKCEGCRYKCQHQEMMFRPIGVCTRATNLIEAERNFNAARCPYKGSLAQHIREMSDYELMEFLWRFNGDSFENVLPFCKNTAECGEQLDSGDISTQMCKQCLLQKLLQPYDSASL